MCHYWKYREIRIEVGVKAEDQSISQWQSLLAKIPIDNESREAGLASCVYQKLNSFEAKKMRTQKKKREWSTL